MNDPRLPDDGDVVVLVDPDGTPRGTAPRSSVHTTDTPLHLAFSAYLFDDDGRLLLTRRALGKVAWPGVWSNSCCGHLRPGETAEQAGLRRIREELGADVASLAPALPDFRYRAVDASGVVEHEICPVFAGRIDERALAPDPAEIAEWCWVPWTMVVTLAQESPALISPWAVLQIRELAASGFAPDERSLSDSAHQRPRSHPHEQRSLNAPQVQRPLSDPHQKRPLSEPCSGESKGPHPHSDLPRTPEEQR